MFPFFVTEIFYNPNVSIHSLQTKSKKARVFLLDITKQFTCLEKLIKKYSSFIKPILKWVIYYFNFRY